MMKCSSSLMDSIQSFLLLPNVFHLYAYAILVVSFSLPILVVMHSEIYCGRSKKKNLLSNLHDDTSIIVVLVLL